MAEPATETFGFQTEAKQLLKLMIHSLYSNREIFLRELISNASDAIDKLRFKSISQTGLLDEDSDFRIRVSFDKEAGTLTIADNGIGMTRQEVIDNLGTIARSGTADFLNSLTGDQKKDARLIGQFGVGFYSAFIVAEEVEVITRAASTGDSRTGVRWVSKGEDAFSISEVDDVDRGTEVILHLRADALEFADDYRLRHIVRRYSDHIGVPVEMPVAGNDPESSDDGKKAADTPVEFEVVNSAKALWTRSRSEITDDEYREFYKHISHDFQDPLTWSHNRVEGKFEYTSLLYLPRHAPFDLWNREAPKGLKLYVQRVFIMDEAEQFLPLYLRFIRGVVDSADLPLNVSRDILQQDREVEAMRGAITRRVLDMLAKLAEEEPARYLEFWQEFGSVLKEGIAEDPANRDRLARLLRFATSREGDAQEHSLAGYVSRMIAGQKHIYYVTADTVERARTSPHLEALRARSIEALLLTDRVDEWMVSHLGEFEGHALRDAARGELDLEGLQTPEQSTAARVAASDVEPACQRLASVLGGKVAAVRASQRLAESAVCLVRSEHEPGPQLRRLLEAAGQ
ncbi:MAG: molecular chaperone HtpG, partial [Pseudomonadales bacterium]|nr:molecular chaperone HtpG [Pseudomonadales bacterium]